MTLSMPFLQSSTASYLLLLLAAAISTSTVTVSAFDANQCSVFVFRTDDNKLWHCGDKLPGDYNEWMASYCDHNQGADLNVPSHKEPFAWASHHPDDWCDFMIATVRQNTAGSTDKEDQYPLTPYISIENTPGPTKDKFHPIVDWGCYMVDMTQGVRGVTTASYLVDSRKGEHASTVHQQCQRTTNYFDYWGMDANVRNLKWWGHLTDVAYTPTKNRWERCHYDSEIKATHYEKELGVEYAECQPGYRCERKYADYALCFPDPHTDHECCISWHNKCKKQGDCCAGSECSASGFCDTQIPQVYEDPPGICEHNTKLQKEDRKVWNRCYEYQGGDQGDCALGYLCKGNWWYAQCELDMTVKDDCCMWNWDTSKPRPGDCCEGWYSHCHSTDPVTGECTLSQCIPGRETGTDEWGNSMLDVHDRLCQDTPPLASFNEPLGECSGAICGIWGDPHIITCDELHFDCQAVGLFTIMKNQMFNIQGNFLHLPTAWGGASITTDLAIDYLKDDAIYGGNSAVPTMQFSFPNFETIDQNDPVYDPKSRYIGACPVMLYLDGQLVDISGVKKNGYLMGSDTTDYSIKLKDWNQIDIKHLGGVDKYGQKYYSQSVIWVEGGGPFSDWSCIFSYFICLPKEEEQQFKDTSLGLLGTPTGSTKDDWMAADGQTLMIPAKDRNQAAFDYCVDNWCVPEEQSIITYGEGLTFEDYECQKEQSFTGFDVDKCFNKEEVVFACKDQKQVVACQMEKCAGNPEVKKEIETVETFKNITKTSDSKESNILEFDNAEDDEYGDCTNLGAGLSGTTGKGAYGLTFPSVGSIFGENNDFSIGHENSVSLLVGRNFRCKSGVGFEGRGVFLGDMTIDRNGCERLVATTKGSLIHPFDNTPCIEIMGDISIDADFQSSKYIMNEDGNKAKSCHLAYKKNCLINGKECTNTTMTALEENFVYTSGDFKKDETLNLKIWRDELVLLRQKTFYWKTLPANGVAEGVDGVLEFGVGPDNNPVQIFRIDPIDTNIASVVFKKEMLGKTIMILVDDVGDFNVPPMCFHPTDANPGDAPICGVDTFPVSLTSSIVWVFTKKGTVTMNGLNEIQGSIVLPRGNLIFKAGGHSGRMIVGGDLTINGRFSELHNYEFDPVSKPLPLGDGDLSKVCEIQPAPVCNETAKPLTSKTACASRPNGVVKLIKSSAKIPEGEPILYDIIIEDPKDLDSAKTVKFKVDSPFTNYTDIYIKHAKKISKHGMDPTCQSMPFTAGCNLDAPEIEVACHEYKGIEAFALVNIYFASNTDYHVMEIGAGNKTQVDKCCQPPEEYADGYGIVEYTFEIQCTCDATILED